MDANQIQNLFASNVRQLLVDADLDYDKLYEIRLRVGRPLFLTYDGGECFLRQKDTEPYLVTREDLKETLEYVSGYSLYAYEDEIRQGFLSVQGGHRVGVIFPASMSVWHMKSRDVQKKCCHISRQESRSCIP